MARGVLLIVNCALDSSYGNCSVLQAMYGNRYDGLVFTVSATCPVDPQFSTIAQRDAPPPQPLCICCNDELGEHGALRHSFHWRLLAVAPMAADYDFVLFTEDDCVISPHWDADRVRRCGEDFDALSPPIRPCSRDNLDWVWTQHAAGYPAFDAATERLDHRRLASHWADYGGTSLPPAAEPVMFYGFCDFFLATNRIWRGLMKDLDALRHVWHEAAIPTSLLHQTPRIGVSTGLPLWGCSRDRPLSELMGLLDSHDFVHAIKLSRYSEEEILAAWSAI